MDLVLDAIRAILCWPVEHFLSSVAKAPLKTGDDMPHTLLTVNTEHDAPAHNFSWIEIRYIALKLTMSLV